MKYDTPHSIDKIGKEVFMELPLYKRRNKLKPIYINKDLYEKKFGIKFEWDTASKKITDYFSVTILDEYKKDNEIIGKAYTDYQADPTDISLNGNKGSGRAYYIDKNFNIKGEKTPLATSPRKDYNNGKYSLDSALWEAVISNLLSVEGYETFNTLVVFDNKESYKFPFMSEEIQCATLVRHTKNDELYRISHRFINKIPFKKEELYTLTASLGKLEGNKFIDRFIHGAWSLGNLTHTGKMIDLDTSFFLNGRHPGWIFTDKYKTNYFGYEDLGQIKVLEIILNSELNIDKIKLNDLEKILNQEKENKINERFMSLIGLDIKYKNLFKHLSKEFTILSKKMFNNYKSLNITDKNHNLTNIFDFSRFFRYYEILKINNVFNINNALKLLLNENSELLEYEEKDDKNFFEKDTIKDSNEYYKLISRAISFIEEFDNLNEFIKQKDKIDSKAKLVESYYKNEDRNYLKAENWIRTDLLNIYKKYGAERVNSIINIIIECSKRNEEKEQYKTDVRIYEEGIFYRIINKNGYFKEIFETYDNNIKTSVLKPLNELIDIEYNLELNPIGYEYKQKIRTMKGGE